MAEWADLPEELLNLILSKLYDKDRHNFKYVCRSLHGVATCSQYQNTPCLLYYDRRELLWGFFQFNTFFYRSFPEYAESAEILCSKYGWLLMARDDRSLFFWNPLNECKVELNTRTRYRYSSVHFFGRPTSPDCFILGISTPIYCGSITIAVLKYGEINKWLEHTYNPCGTEFLVSLTGHNEFLVSLAAPVRHNGLVYILDMKGDIATLDIKAHPSSSAIKVYTKCFKHRRLCSKIRRHYLFKIRGDEALYAVFMIHDTETVNLFRLCEADMKWERVTDLGRRMLYLSHASSFGDTANTKAMENTICFPTFDGENHLLFYSLSTQKYHSFEGDCSFDDLINVERLDYGVAWIAPEPAHQQLSAWYHPNKEYDLNDLEEYDSDDAEECVSDDSESEDSDIEDYVSSDSESEISIQDDLESQDFQVAD